MATLSRFLDEASCYMNTEDAGDFDLARLTLVGWLLAIAGVITMIGGLVYALGDDSSNPAPGGPVASAPEEAGQPVKLSRNTRKALGAILVVVFGVCFLAAKTVLEMVGITVIRPAKKPQG